MNNLKPADGLFNLLIASICGNHCLNDKVDSICQCGDATYNRMQMAKTYSYCCNSSPCNKMTSSNIICNNGTIKNINEKCNNNCPLSQCSQCSPDQLHMYLKYKHL